MKLKFAVPLVALSVASTAAMAATQASGSSQSSMQGASAPMMSINCANNNMSACMGGTYDPTQMTMMNALKGSANWTDVIKVSLLMNVDAFAQNNYQGDTLIGYEGQNSEGSSGFAYNARLNIDSQVNNWVSAHLGLFMANGTASEPGVTASSSLTSSGSQPYGINGGYGTRYYVASDNQSGIDVDEAYITIENAAKSPIGFRAGRQYVAFGQYNLNAMMPTLYEQAVKTRQEALTLGYYGNSGMASGLSIQGYAFNGIQKSSATDGSGSNNINSWGASIGYQHSLGSLPNAHANGNFQVSYLSNYFNTGLLTAALDNAAGGSYTDSVGALAFDGTLRFGQVPSTTRNRFVVGAHYVMPTSGLNLDNGLVNIASVDSTNNIVTTDTSKPRPQAGTVLAGITFMTMNHPSQFQLNYQWSRDYNLYGGSLGIVNYVQMPKSRVGGLYSVTLLPKTQLGLGVNWDDPASQGNGGSGEQKNVLTGIARLSVLLA